MVEGEEEGGEVKNEWLNSPHLRLAFIRGAAEAATRMLMWKYPQISGDELCGLVGDTMHGFLHQNGIEPTQDEWYTIGRVGGRKWLTLVGDNADIFAAQCAGVFTDANPPQ